MARSHPTPRRKALPSYTATRDISSEALKVRFYSFGKIEVESRASGMLGNSSASEPHPWPGILIFKYFSKFQILAVSICGIFFF